ncbi:MAG: chemotaxis protein CheW, partial [Gammaproteobacteria bacterium]
MQAFIIHDCWNKIGIWGKEKPRCRELDELVHCNNCPVYAEAGRMLLGRPVDKNYLDEWLGNLSKPRDEASDQTHSALCFRLGDEWFALPSAIIREITHCSKHHSLPHRKNRVLRGLVNVRGELLLCFSLGALFQLQKSEKELASIHVHER